MPRLVDFLTSREVLFPAARQPLPDVLVSTNEGEFDAAWGERVRAVYAGRVALFDPIILGRLPAGATLRGGGDFLLTFDGDVAADTVPHIMREQSDLLAKALADQSEPGQLDEECVVLARYGHGTWGHWLAELLPIAALVERRYPGRFRYAVPLHASGYGATMRESLRAYGIDASRLILIDYKPLRLRKAWAVTPVWSDMAPHPAAVDVVRGAVSLSAHRPEWSKIALMRRDWITRGIANGDEVEVVLREAGFTITDAVGLPFVDQVRMFQTATTVFGVIGSGLTGLLYSPNHVRVIGAGPAIWGDRFFYALAQQRAARWSEVRGRSSWDGKTGLMRDAPFTVPIETLRAELTEG